MVGSGSCAPLLDFDVGQTNRLKVARCKEVNAAVVDLIAKKADFDGLHDRPLAQIRPWRRVWQ